MKTAVVILNWNGLELLKQFLPGLVASCKGVAEVVVADNASSDSSISWLKTEHPEVTIIINDQNYGYAGGYNKALESVDADYFVLLNSDVEVTPGWIQTLISYMDRHPDIAVCQPKLRWHRIPEKFEYAGAAGGYIDLLGYPFCRGRVFNVLENDEGQYEDPKDVFWASGACMMIRSEVFRKCGGFDASFFAHMEEIDLCWRILNAGYKIRYVPESVVYHVGGATLPKSNPRKTYLNFRNNLSMLYKNLPGRLLIPVMIARIFLDLVAALKFLLEGDAPDFLAVLKAHFSFIGRLLDRTVRREKNLTSGLHPTIYKGSVVWQHYVKRVREFRNLPFNLK